MKETEMAVPWNFLAVGELRWRKSFPGVLEGVVDGQEVEIFEVRGKKSDKAPDFVVLRRVPRDPDTEPEAGGDEGRVEDRNGYCWPGTFLDILEEDPEGNADLLKMEPFAAMKVWNLRERARMRPARSQ